MTTCHDSHALIYHQISTSKYKYNGPYQKLGNFLTLLMEPLWLPEGPLGPARRQAPAYLSYWTIRPRNFCIGFACKLFAHKVHESEYAIMPFST